MKRLFLIISLFFVSCLVANEDIQNKIFDKTTSGDQTTNVETKAKYGETERSETIKSYRTSNDEYGESFEDHYNNARKVLDEQFNKFSQNLYYLNENVQERVFMKNLISNKEDEKTFVYEIDMPGIEKKDVVIEVIDGENGKIINITGKKDFKSKELVKNRLYSFSISYPKNTNKLNASMLNGVLKLTFDKIKKDEKQARKIIEIQ